MAKDQADYDSIALKYVKGRNITSREPVEEYTIYNCMLRPLLDDRDTLSGKRVLDLACGQGYHTRKLKQLNCDYILGVDVSSKMIELARETERQDPQGIEYMVLDIKQLPPPEQPFDLVIGFHLLNYARTREELLEMVGIIYMQLDENKQFIGVAGNVVGGKDSFNQRKYGVTRHTKIPLDNGPIPDDTELIVTLYNEQDEPACTFSNYFLAPTIYEQVFKEAGFKSFHWVPYQCDPNVPNKAFYDDLIKCANGIGIVATK